MAKSNKRILISLGVLIVLALLTVFSAGVPRLRSRASGRLNQSSSQPDRSQRNQQDAATQKRQELQARIPTIAYDSPEPTNSAEKAKRRKRNKHYDGKNLVMTNPSGSGTATIVDDDSFSRLPSLPVTQSDVILTADVLNSGAHLSNDKSGVYSEFNVQIDTVLKGVVASLSQTNLVSLSRQGGVVRYPSGRTERYLIAHQNMPATGRRYLFFLKTTDDPQAFEIITGYEISPERVSPLDWGRQFESFRGTNLVAFLNSVREAIAKN